MVDGVTVAETQPVWKESRGKQRGRKQKATGRLFLISNYNSVISFHSHAFQSSPAPKNPSQSSATVIYFSLGSTGPGLQHVNLGRNQIQTRAKPLLLWRQRSLPSAEQRKVTQQWREPLSKIHRRKLRHASQQNTFQHRSRTKSRGWSTQMCLNFTLTVT